MDYKTEVSKIIDGEMYNLKGYAKKWVEKIKNKKYICVFGAGNHAFNWINYFLDCKMKCDS